MRMHEHDLAILSFKLCRGSNALREQRDHFIACGSAALPLLSSYLRRCAETELGEDAIECAELIAAIGGQSAATALIDILLAYQEPEHDEFSDFNGDVSDELRRAHQAARAGLLALGPVAIPQVRSLVAHANSRAAELARDVLATLDGKGPGSEAE